MRKGLSEQRPQSGRVDIDPTPHSPAGSAVTLGNPRRGAKWQHYQRILSLKEYVLVSQTRRIERYRRLPTGAWEYVEVLGRGQLTLVTGAVVDLDALYSELPE